MFEKFTEGAIKVIMLSQEEARRMGHNFVGTEQLLLGVIGQRHGLGAKALKKVRVTLKKARKEIELYIGRGTGFVASEIPFTPRAKRVLEMAVHEGKDLGQNFVGTEHILLALIAESDGVAMRTLDKLNVDIPRLRNLVLALIEETQEEVLRPLTQAEKFLMERDKKGIGTPTLDEYAENITKEAMEGRLDPVIGREEEIENVIAVLARRGKNNPVLIGEPGVGKTAVAEGLAQLLLTNDAPDFLEGSVIMALDIGSILAGTKYRGEFEDRLKRIIEEAQNDPSIIIVIDEIHTLVGAGAAEGAVDAANILKPALARGKFRCIGATTKEEYKKYIERDAALERRFQPVYVEEPSVSVAIEIVKGVRPKFEEHHALGFHDKALSQSVVLSHQYIADRYLPDKALDVLDEAGARVRLQNRHLPLGFKLLLNELQETMREKGEALYDHDFEAAIQLIEHEQEVRSHIRILQRSAIKNQVRGIKRQYIDMVTEHDIADVVSRWTGIPVTKITGPESERLVKMEEIIHERIIGQKHAVNAVSRAIRRARVGLRDPKRPIASFIFAGPTGVGKTELTKALAEYIFSGDDSMIRLDMSEYMEKHTVAKLIGSPPGYVGYNEGGLLTEAVRDKPYSIVLLDEVEKAHPDVFNLLLQVLDDGRLTDSKGRVIDFTNTLVIMTTNLGSKIIERESGIKPKSEMPKRGSQVTPHPVLNWEPEQEPIKDPEIFERVSKLVNEELKNFFRPEFLNRIDEIIVFNHLTRHDIWQICQLMIKQIEDRLSEKNIKLIVELSVRAFLADEGYDPIYGARPLRRAIMTHLEDALVDECLSTTLYPNTKLIVDRKKVPGSIFNYTNKLEVTADFTDVDPKLWNKKKTEDANLDNENVTLEIPKIPNLTSNAIRSENTGRKSETMKSKVVESPDESQKSVTDKSEAVTDKSEAVTDKSEAVTDKSEAVTDKSEAVTDKSESVTDKSESVTDKSESVTDKSKKPGRLRQLFTRVRKLANENRAKKKKNK